MKRRIAIEKYFGERVGEDVTEELYRAGRAAEVACMAHIRRTFVDVHQSQGSAIGAEAIDRIAALYAVEAEARDQPPDERVRIRQAKARPIFDDLMPWHTGRPT